jgi:hypothetical protein
LQGRDPKLSPKPPKGFPAEMMIYHNFARLRGWPPYVVRRLRLDELYWLPLLEEATGAAIEQVRDD